MIKPLTTSFFKKPTPELARNLLGKLLIKVPASKQPVKFADLPELLRQKDVQIGMISEVEAYDEQDPASHSFNGPTPRNQAMFAEAGTFYVYQIYGIHYCMNIASHPVGVGAAVLLRAVIPLYGLELMRKRRGVSGPRRGLWGPRRGLWGPHRKEGAFTTFPDNPRAWIRLYKALTGGPGKLTRAFAIDKKNNAQPPLRSTLDSSSRSNLLLIGALPSIRIPKEQILATPRIGITTLQSKNDLLRWVIREDAWVSLALAAYRYLTLGEVKS